MTAFDFVDVQCPICEEPFEAAALLGANAPNGQRSDFHAIAAGIPPLPFEINTCPTCGFSGELRAFTNPEPLGHDLKARIMQELAPLVRANYPDCGTRFALAACVAQFKGAPALEIAHLYLRAAWCCVEEKSHTNERDYREAAIQHFHRALERGEVPENEQPTISYLIGELHRRIGNQQIAAQWFDLIIDNASYDEGWHEIAWLAEQQRDAPKEILD